MTNSFINTFGGSAVSPADVAYASYTFGSNLILFWPTFANGQTNVAARFMNMTATASSLEVLMPDATLVSVGYDVLMVNVGSNTFNVVSLNGNAICTIAAGQAFYINLNENTTQDGVWQVIQFGVGTGAAVASALAGAGLLASGNLLEQNILGTTLSGNTTIASTARAILQVWTGGAGTITLPLASSVGNGFFFPFANDGSSSVTLATTGSDLIDGMSTSIFSQSQSAFIVSTGSAWYTVGKGLQNNFSVTILNLNVAGGSDVTETSAQAQNIIQQFTGILTASINVIMPATPQIYFVYNNTSGAFTLTVKTAAGTGVQVAQGTNTILYCDGTNIVVGFSSSFGGSISLPTGSAGAPALNFVGSTSTGIYSPALNQFAITAGGYEVMNFTAPTGSVNFFQAAASSTGADISLFALGSDSNISWDLVPKGSGFIKVTNFWTNTASISGGTINSTVIGGSTPSTITGTSLTVTGSSVPANGVYLPSSNQPSIAANNQIALGISGVSSTPNYLIMNAAVSGGSPSIQAAGGDTNVNFNFISKGSGGFGILTNGSVTQLAVTHTGSAVNWVNLTGGTTGNPVTISSAGVNTDIGIALVPKGAGAVTAPTPSNGDNSTKVATTAFVAANNTSKVTPYTVVTDTTDISLSTVPTQSNVGSTFSMTIPTKGIIIWNISGETVIATNAAALVFGLRIGSTNYWPTSLNGGTTEYAWTLITGGAGTFIFSSIGAIGGPSSASVGDPNTGSGSQPCGLSIEGSGIPTGVQTVQVIAGYTTAGSPTVTLKGTVHTTRVYITVYDHT